jgi:hypothetical protein
MNKMTKHRPVMRAADPLPPSVWRVYLRYLAKWMLISILGLLWLAFLTTCVYCYANGRP